MKSISCSIVAVFLAFAAVSSGQTPPQIGRGPLAPANPINQSPANAAWLVPNLLWNGSTSQTNKVEQMFRPDQILIGLKPGITGATMMSAAPIGSQLTQVFSNRIAIVKIPSGRVAEFLQLYRNTGLVEYAEPDFICVAFCSSERPKICQPVGSEQYGKQFWRDSGCRH
jgi:hypothetical protein